MLLAEAHPPPCSSRYPEKRFSSTSPQRCQAVAVAASSAWAGARRILCVRLDAIGDVLMTGPALGALKRALPERTLTLLTSPAGAAAAELLPQVDELIVYPAPWMKHSEPRADSAPDAAMIERLRAGGFDAAAIFTVYSQTPLPAALLCHLAGIPLRAAHCRENPYGLLTDWLREPEPETLVRHEVRRQLDLVAALGGVPGDERLELSLPPPAVERAAELLRELGLEGRGDWLVVHPGSTAPSRRYPAEDYVGACRELAEEHGVGLLFTGTPEERELAEAIRARLPGESSSLAGELELAELAALLERAPLLLAGNTGPVHLAAAVGTPVVDLYALTNPQHTPWGVRSRVLFHDVPCRWCYGSVCREGHHHCLRLVKPAEVVAAVLELLDDPGPARPAAGEGDFLPWTAATLPIRARS
jgi:lipopolysaccharide heptosyltransferase II